MATRGQKPRYTSVEEVSKIIDAYFEKCEGVILQDDDGNIAFDKRGNPIVLGAKPPTITGLALALGFTNRQSLLNYQAKKEFKDVITRAKSRVEQYVEEQLFNREGANGARFSLQNNFKGWRDPEANAEDTRKEIVVVELTRKNKEPDAATATQHETDQANNT